MTTCFIISASNFSFNAFFIAVLRIMISFLSDGDFSSTNNVPEFR